MKCVDLMWVDAPALSPEHSVADASAALLRARVRSLPVIDSDRQILGMFGIHQLLALMVPRIGNMELGLRNMAFIKDDIEDLQRRLGRSTERPVGELMSTEFVSLQEDAFENSGGGMHVNGRKYIG